MNFMGLNLAANCMFNSQKALEIVGQNISNANVEGYTRQKAVQAIITSGYSVEPPQAGALSIGSMITEIVRYRSEFVDLNYRSELIRSGEISSESAYLDEVAEIFTDYSDYGIPALLNDFWQSWNRSAQNPGDMALRKMVIEKGNTLTNFIRHKAHKIDDVSARLDNEIQTTVDRVNSVLQKLASINDQIIPSLPKTFQVNLLMDQRDNLIDELSELVDIQVVGDVRESIDIYADGAPLLSGKNAFPITLQEDASHNFHFISSGGRELTIRGGKLKGLMDIRTDYIPTYRAEFDEMTKGLIDNVNKLHKFGYGLDGSTGLDYFKGSSAADIQVNITIPENIALSVPKLTGTANMNVDGSLLMPDVTLSDGSANFLTTPEASGTIRVNGVDIDWADTDTLQDILDNIYNTTGITATFDLNSQKVSLSAPPDSSTITIIDISGNFTAFTNLGGAVTTGGEPGDGANGTRIFNISTKTIFGAPDPNETINDKYKNLVAGVGFDTNTVKSSNRVQKEYIESLYEMRQSEGGVSIDEEVIELMKHQRAFQAGARLAAVADEMLNSLLSMI